YVAAVKAKILSEKPDAQIIDISHDIRKFDIIQSAHLLKSVYQDFPEGTLHMVAVNTNNIPEDLIAIKMKGHYFMGNNNGLFSLIVEKDPEKIIQLSGQNKKDVFPAKNVMALAAANFLKENNIDKLGESFDLSKYQKYMPLRVKANTEMIQGHVVHIDSYGNLITNISKVDYDILSKDKNTLIKFRTYGLTRVLHNYHETKGGDAFALFNSNGYLEIGIKEGNAAELLGMEYSSVVSIKFSDY
ncbi:MAG: SAM-dependent chlorinase/fluorinase, partial [Nitrososphaeraceae archaeon]|nr:SAM-dependent chlorinase/fluorinase [Nitrososphaeraceae archaeon]